VVFPFVNRTNGFSKLPNFLEWLGKKFKTAKKRLAEKTQQGVWWCMDYIFYLA